MIELKNDENILHKNESNLFIHTDQYNNFKSESLFNFNDKISKNHKIINESTVSLKHLDEILTEKKNNSKDNQIILSENTPVNQIIKEEKTSTLKHNIAEMEKLSIEYSKSNSNENLEEIEDLLKKNENNLEIGHLEPFENISLNLWECLMSIAFKYLEKDEIKSHYLISKILYHTYDKIIEEKTINYALAKFHFAKSQKDFNSNFNLSYQLFNESLGIVKQLGEENTKIGLTIKYFLGTLYDDMGMYDESIELLRDVLQNQIKIFSEENFFVAKTYNCLGIAEDNRGNLKPAREYYQKSYKIFKILSFGMETVDSVKVLNNLAGIYYRWEDYSTSLKLYSIVLDTYEKKYGIINNFVAITYNNIGNCYQMLGDIKKALFYLQKALGNSIESFGQNHPQTAMTYKNLGDLYLNMDDKKKSLEMFHSCVNIFKEKYGEENEIYLSTLGKIIKLKKNT